MNYREQVKCTVDVSEVINKGNKSPQATYKLMDSI